MKTSIIEAFATINATKTNSTLPAKIKIQVRAKTQAGMPLAVP